MSILSTVANSVFNQFLSVVDSQSLLEKPEGHAYTFDQSEPIDQSRIYEMLETVAYNGQQYYSPPMDYQTLSRAYHATPWHSSPIQTKLNILVSLYRPNPRLSLSDFRSFVQDYLIYGNAYLEKVTGRLGTWTFKHSHAKYTRRGIDLDTYYFIQPKTPYGLQNYDVAHTFAAGSIYHLMNQDFNQEIYGIPTYLSALNSAWLNNSATLFRQRFYDNGAHAGSIIYVNENETSDATVKSFVEQLKKTKQKGNFKNLFLHLPGGKKDGVQVIPLSEATGKDEFFNITKVTKDNMLAAHRVPPSMMSVVPEHAGGFGDVEKIAKVFFINELAPLQTEFLNINEWAGEKVICFNQYALLTPDSA